MRSVQSAIAAVFFSLALAGCASTPLAPPPNAQAIQVDFPELNDRPKAFAGKLVETTCLLTNDGFETQWLTRGPDRLKSHPIPYSFSDQGSADKAGLALLRGAMTRKRAWVTIQGRLKIDPKALEPWPVQFVIDRIVSASPPAP